MKIKIWTDKQLMKGAEPIFLPGDKKIGVLLFHGWSSSPQEFNPDYVASTAKHINSLGYTVYVPLRIGHGTEPDDFQGLHWEDWLKDAREHFNAFSTECEKIVVGGMSMGANLALHIAKENDVAGVIPMGTPIFMRLHGLFGIWAWFNRLNEKIRHKKYLPQDQEIAMKKVHYTKYPTYHLYENLKAASDTKKILPDIFVPALVIHSANDNVVSPRSARYIYKNIGSSDKTLVLVENSYHSFTTDRNVDKANQAIGDFLGKLNR